MRSATRSLTRASALLGVLLISALLPASAFSAEPTAPEAAAAPASAPQSYRIASGDVLAITTWGQPQFTQDCQVSGVGTISFPVVGELRAAGLTISEFQASLEEHLRKYIKQPQVSVTVRQYGTLGTSVFVLGEVKNPGVYPLMTGAGLMQVLAAAGGPTPQASGQVTIAKARTGELVTVGLEQAVLGAGGSDEAAVEPGDAIMLQRKPEADMSRRYVVLGEVPTPGMFDMPAQGEVHVLDAMEKAGLLKRSSGNPGTTADYPQLADLENALLVRGEVVVPLNLKALLEGDISQDVLLQAGDVITVPRRKVVTVYAMGEVRSAGRHLLPVGSTVLDLLNAVGGVNPNARLSQTSILRQVDGKPTPMSLDLGALLRGGDAKQNITLQEGDVLFVPARGESSQAIWRWLPLIPYLLR